MKKLTNEEYVNIASGVHKNFYIYEKTEYTLSRNKITITCPNHGDFIQEANSHLRGIGCSRCSNNHKLNSEEFSYRASLIHNNKYDYSLVEYKRAHSKIKIICPTHGVFEQTPQNHLNYHGCPMCGFNLIRKKMSKNLEEFIIDCNKKHGDKYDYSLVEYKNAKNKVKIICKDHGIFEQEAYSHIFGSGCNKCYIQKSSKSKTKTNDEFINDAIQIHGYKYIYYLVEYIGTDSKIKIICRDHGIFEQKPSKHLQNQGCPTCRESKLENKIRLFLSENNIKYKQQYGKKGDDFYLNGQILDFYLPEYLLAIECQGEQHFNPVSFGSKKDIQKEFEKIKSRDINKKFKCSQNNIRILYFCDSMHSNYKNNYIGEMFDNLGELLEKIYK